MKRTRAFSLVEALIAILVIGILGGTIVTALWFFFSSYGQSEDYIEARLDVDEIFHFLTPQLTNVGLGMPNNRAGRGSFNAAFKGEGSNNPIMEQMGDTTRDDPAWGGPITIANGADNYTNAGKCTTTVIDGNGRNVYVGSVLYYTWAIPTEVKVDTVISLDFEGDGVPDVSAFQEKHEISYPDNAGDPEYQLYNPTSQDLAFWSNKHSNSQPYTYILHVQSGGTQKLVDFRYDERAVGIQNSANTRGASVRQWIVFPSTRAPLLIYSNPNSVNVGDDTIEVQVAPYSYNDHGLGAGKNVLIGGRVLGYEEVHLVQSASLFVNDDNELVQRVFMGRPGQAAERIDKVLKPNVAGVCFRFDPDSRLLTFYIAMFGDEVIPLEQRGIPAAWPTAVAPPSSYFKNFTRVSQRRILVESMIWRIRN